MNDHKILHLVIDLSGFGGAEMTLLRYLSAQTDAGKRHRIIALRTIRPGPSVGERLKAAGIHVQTLGIESLSDIPRGLIALFKTVRSAQASLISAWLYYPALIATVMRPFLSAKPKVIWNIRSLPYGQFQKKPLRWLAQRILARLSSRSWISTISNSTASKESHEALGYDTTRWHVIPNAIDPSLYQPNVKKREGTRMALKIQDHHFVIGTVGRDVPEKGLPDLFAAFGDVYQRASDVDKTRLILMVVGRGITADAPHISALLNRNNIPNSVVRLLGARDDVPELMNAFDCFVMSSHSESFPNVLAEAMATARLCLSTTVGDCARVLNDEELLFPPHAPDQMANMLRKILTLSENERQRLGNKNRDRVMTLYAPEVMIEGFNQIFDEA